jgi:hypothetical protein
MMLRDGAKALYSLEVDPAIIVGLRAVIDL